MKPKLEEEPMTLLQSELDRLREMAREEIPIRRCNLHRMHRRLAAARLQRDVARRRLAQLKRDLGMIDATVLKAIREETYNLRRMLNDRDDKLAAQAEQIARLKKRSWLNRLRDRLGLWR